MVAKLRDEDVGSDRNDSLREPVRSDQSAPACDGTGILACADLDAIKLVRQAKNGNPGALGKILTRLALHLRGETPLPREHAAFCSEALLELGETLVAAERGFWEYVAEADRNLANDPVAQTVFRIDVAQGKGPRLPEQARSPDGESWSQKPSRDQLGRAFCQAFHITPRTGAARTSGGWKPYRACPSRKDKAVRTREDYLDKMSALIHCGESQTQAIKILRSAVQEPKSATTIRRWMEDEGFHDKIDPKEKERKTLNFGFVVLACVEGGMDLEEACSRLARTRVQGACGLPDATVFLQPRTVKAAYDLAMKRSPSEGAGTDQ